MTRRIITLTFAIYLTILLGLSLALITQQPKEMGEPAGYSSQSATITQSPKRDIYTQNPKVLRIAAKRWLLQRIHLEEWRCIDKLIYRESRWIPNQWNSQGSDAYGLGQVKGSYHYTKDKPFKQFKVAVRVAIHKHGTLCNALDHSYKHGWY